MKKEKNLKKVNSKEKENNEIRRLIKLLNVAEIFLIALPLVRIGLIVITVLLTMASGDVVNIDEITQDLFAGTKMINIIEDDEYFGSLALFLSCAGYIVNIKIINTIKKVIINFYEDKTPFSEKNIVLLDNEENLGFVGTVNKGMQYSKNDVILLNSDTEVTKNWIEKIQECAYSNEYIATVTPLTNNGTICSVPNFGIDNELPSNMTLDEYAEMIEKTSLKLYLEI